jgi:hypothetical protein
MSFGDTTENELLALIFNATDMANIADNDVAAPLTNLSVALHTADPGEAGNQTTNETAYTGYARVNVARTSGGWSVSTNTVSPVANIEFGECTASPGGNITHASVGKTGGGATQIIASGALTPNITMGVGVIPRITTASTFSLT